VPLLMRPGSRVRDLKPNDPQTCGENVDGIEREKLSYALQGHSRSHRFAALQGTHEIAIQLSRSCNKGPVWSLGRSISTFPPRR
jgi:hypothetical protein